MPKIPDENIVPKELWPDLELPEEYKDLPDEINLAEEFVDRNVERGLGNNVAIYYEDRKITYRELSRMSSSVADSLANVGVEANDRVAFRTRNLPEAVIANWGMVKAGAIPVPMSGLWSRHEISYVANNADVKYLFTTTEPEMMKEVEGAKDDIETLEGIVVIDGEDYRDKEGYIVFEDLLKGNPRFEPVKKSKVDPAVFMYTSGTTGPPKGCTHFVENVVYEADVVGEKVWTLSPSDVIVGPAPVSFAAGYGTFQLIPERFGAASALMYRFRPPLYFEHTEKYGGTVWTGLPTAFRAVLAMSDLDDYIERYDLSGVKYATAAGERLGIDIFNKWNEKFPFTIYEGLGTTENVHLVTSSKIAPKGPKPGSIGVPLPGYDVKIVDPDTEEEVGPGEVGEMRVKGPTGIVYWKPYADDNRLLKKQKKSVKEGWSTVGDLVKKDEDGYIFFESRDDDVIKTSGYRVGPGEVEDALETHDAVKCAAVIPVPHPKRGQDAKVYINLAEGVEPKDELKDELLDYLKGKVAKYKLPRHIEFTDKEIPVTPTGKKLRRIVRGWEEEA